MTGVQTCALPIYEQFQYLLIAALVLLLLEFVVLDRRNPLLAHLNIFREK